jgi:hydrogenase maturation protease
MRKALVIGYGNPLRGDDGAGQAVARALADEAIAGVEVVACHQLVPEFAPDIAAAALVVFVDAVVSAPAGEVAARPLGELSADPAGLAHHVEAAGLVAMARALYGRAPAAFLVGIGAGAMELGEGFSDEVAAAVPRAVAEVRRLLAAHRSEG